MSRRKKPLVPWATKQADGKDTRFIQLGSSLLLSHAWNSLSYGAQAVYIRMMLESGGKPEFTFPAATMAKYNMPRRSCQRHIEELTKAGFIRCKVPGKSQFIKSEYAFSYEWKAKP